MTELLHIVQLVHAVPPPQEEKTRGPRTYNTNKNSRNHGIEHFLMALPKNTFRTLPNNTFRKHTIVELLIPLAKGDTFTNNTNEQFLILFQKNTLVKQEPLGSNLLTKFHCI